MISKDNFQMLNYHKIKYIQLVQIEYVYILLQHNIKIGYKKLIN
jgi:hypothetical protein